MNQALCDMSGYAWHDDTRDGFDLIAPEHRELVYGTCWPRDEPYEIECVRRDGVRVPVEVQAHRRPAAGRCCGWSRSATSRRAARPSRARDSLVRALEEKNAELEQHRHPRLKAPLVTVRGFADHID